MTRYAKTIVEQIEPLLDEGSAPDEIAVLLGLDEREVKRIALLLAERGPAEAATEVEVADVVDVVEQVEDLPEVPAVYGDDIRQLLGVHGAGVARSAVRTIADRATGPAEVRDLAAMLGLTGALADYRTTVADPTEDAGLVEEQHDHEKPCDKYEAAAHIDDGNFPSIPHVIAAGSGDDAPCRVEYDPAPTTSFLAGYDVPRQAGRDHQPAAGVLPVDDRADEATATVARCQHDIGPAWTKSGQAYALCARCGATWHRAPCDYPGCEAHVSGLFIATTGRARHAHHNLPKPRKD